MPFAPEFDNVFEIVRHAVEACGLTCTRADSLTTTDQITDDIWSSIRDARVLIADITSNNPNVFYETGVAHALDRPVILITQQINQMPFDLRGVRCFGYDSKALKGLAQALPNFIRASLEIPVPLIEDPSFDDSAPPNVRLTSIKIPGVATIDEPIRVEIRARNYGGPAGQAYFSASFPRGFDNIKVLRSDCKFNIGRTNESWGNGSIILHYPIAEGYTYSEPFWAPRIEHCLIIEAQATSTGLLQIYFSASCQTDPLQFAYDPTPVTSPLRDQRDEPVYCGVVEVVNRRT